jgi:hypothetical protein
MNFIYQGWIPVQAGHYSSIEHSAKAQHDATFRFVYHVEAHKAPDDSCNRSHTNQQAGRYATLALGPPLPPALLPPPPPALPNRPLNFLTQVFDDFIDVRWPLVTTATATTTPRVIVFTVITRFIPSHWFLHSFLKRKNRF